MAANYGVMQAEIAGDLTITGLTSEIKLAIQSAIRHYEQYRFWFNEGKATASTVNGTKSIAVPTDLIEEDTITITINSRVYELEKKTYQYIESIDTGGITGYPTIYANYADQWWLYPVPNGVYTLSASYLKRLSALSADADTNAWMTKADNLISVRAMREILIHKVQDIPKADSLIPFEQQALEALISETERKMASGKLSPSEY